MAIVNSLLIRYGQGYTRVEHQASIDEFGRREGYVTLGDVRGVAEAQHIGRGLLIKMSTPVLSITVGLEPTDTDDRPYRDWKVGDWVTAPNTIGDDVAFRVAALTVTEDEDGNPVFVPDLNTVKDEKDARVQRALKRMVNGSLRGSIESAMAPQPLPEVTRRDARRVVPPPWSMPGPLLVKVSGGWPPPMPVRLNQADVLLRVAGSTATTVSVLVDAVSVGTVTLAAGATRGTTVLAASVLPSQVVSMSLTAAGAGAEDVTVHLDATTT